MIPDPRSPKPKTLLPFISLATAAVVTTGIGLTFSPLSASSKLLAAADKQQAKQQTVEITLVSYAVTQSAYSKIIPLDRPSLGGSRDLPGRLGR